jgi:leucyl aminopeptidase
MIPELVEKKSELTDATLAAASHALIVCPVSKSLPEIPGRAALDAALARRTIKPADFAKRGATFTLASGTLVACAMVDAASTPFERHTKIRKALEPLLAEHPKKLVVAVQGDAAFRALVAPEAAYCALLNGARLPSHKREQDAALARIELVGAAGCDLSAARAVAEGNTLTRMLAGLPPNELSPGLYRKRIRELAKTHGWKLTEYPFDKLEKMGAGAFCAVAQGSPARDAAIVRVEYLPPTPALPRKRGRAGVGGYENVALVGKGICFDTGGHNLKPARYMHGMHEDMTGSAIVLGMLVAATRLGLPMKLTGWLALAENHISPAAYRQNEVVTALNGTTIEIMHTDAEGRMVLADALTLAARDKPALIVDFATLTGSMHTALGSRMSGVFATSSALGHRAARAGAASGERVVLFPAPEDYDEALDSQVADVKQCTLEGEGDHILATRFLKRFVGDAPWMHVDLSAHQCKGGLGAVGTDITGFGVGWGLRLLLEG